VKKEKGKINENQIREKILEKIRKEKSISQKELWKKLKLKSEIGTRILLKLIREGKIERNVKYVNGKKIYFLSLPTPKIKVIPLNGIEDTVCFSCPDINICSEEGELNPISCSKMSNWLESDI
jgi:MarR family.